MKMQNAEMEFVAFDAQDVIATSGPGTPLGYFAGSVKNCYNTTFEDSGQFFRLGDADCIDKGKSQFNYRDNYYIINSAEYYDDSWGDTNYVLNTTGSYDAPTGSEYKSLDTAGDILEWLQGIATKQ